jgi:hypothetical protein
MFMYKMYDVYMYLFLFCIHVVVGVDDFFVLCYFSSVTSRSGLLLVVRTLFIITSHFDKYTFCCFSFSYPILFLLYFY